MPLDAETTSKLRKQMEFYFSDVNLSRDNHMKGLMAMDKDGAIPFTEFLKFKRVANMTTDIQEMVAAVKPSTELVVDEANLTVRRSKPIPEQVANDDKTAYVKPVPVGATLEELETFFSQYGSVQAIWRRYTNSKDKALKPSVFVVFGDVATAEKFVASPPKFGEEQLTAMMKIPYLEEKAQEINQKKALKKPSKSDAPKTNPMPRGAAYKVHGVGEIKHFGDVKNLWSKAEQGGIRYVFMPDQESCLIIFQDEDTGKSMTAELEKKATTLNGKLPKVDKITGTEEDELIANVDKEIAERAANRAEQGGRGGGRGGRGGRGRGGRGGKRSRD